MKKPRQNACYGIAMYWRKAIHAEKESTPGFRLSAHDLQHIQNTPTYRTHERQA